MHEYTEDSSWDYLFDMAQSEPAEEKNELYGDRAAYDEPLEPLVVPGTPEEVLQKFFGYQTFRTGQREVIEHTLQGRDICAVMPTGAGKSICYQVPALLLPGITLVISPLISLMQDQVKALNEAGIPAALINSSLSEQSLSETLFHAERGQYKLLYIAPERLENQRFLAFSEKVSISMVTVDEAHCISQWGQDFRPSYMKIVKFVNALEKRPILAAFTATATERVREDIICTLGLHDPFTLVTGFDRGNLFFQVEKPKDKDAYVMNYVNSHPDESGIIYCSTRKNVDNVYALLISQGIAAVKYHAGMSVDQRKQMQDDFVFDNKQIVVATNAFGMGIDKSNVRYVIHYNMPQSMENYYQEAGRAGRDGLEAKCLLLFSPQDMMIQRYLLEHKDLTEVDSDLREAVQQRDLQRLQIMERYCFTTECLRNYILKYFGETPTKPCDDCGNCLREFETQDMTEEAKQVINCVYEAKGRFGKNIIIDTVLGKKTARLEEVGSVHYKSFGRLTGVNRSLLLRLIEQMLVEGYLIEGNYRVIRLGDFSRLKHPDVKVLVKITDEDKLPDRHPKTGKQRQGKEALTSAGYQLFDRLKALRLDIAREENMPPYIIFSDRTLIDMAVKVPLSEEEMLAVSGVGAQKWLKYGRRFLAVVETAVEDDPELLSHRASGDGDEKTSSAKKERKIKKEFYLLPEEAEQYAYEEYRTISEIRTAISQLCRDTDRKKISTVKLSEFLLGEGLIVKSEERGPYAKDPTIRGEELGIVLQERVSQAGDAYAVLLYPPAVQRMLVEHFIWVPGSINFPDRRGVHRR